MSRHIALASPLGAKAHHRQHSAHAIPVTARHHTYYTYTDQFILLRVRSLLHLDGRELEKQPFVVGAITPLDH